jgi:hypothetical protein
MYFYTGCVCSCQKQQFGLQKFIYERFVNIVFSYMERTKKTKGHADGIEDILRKMTDLPFSNKRFICYNVL